jgi:hypothetical protein
MPPPSPTPIAYQGQYNLFQATLTFEQGRSKWSEKYLAVVNGASNPNDLMSFAARDLRYARAEFLANNTTIAATHSSYVNQDPSQPVKMAFVGESVNAGASLGTLIPQDPNDKSCTIAGYTPPQLAQYIAWWDPSRTVHERRPHRGLRNCDNTWNPSGGYVPSPKVNGGLNALLAVLKTPYSNPQAGPGTVQWVMESSQYLPGPSPLPQILSPLSVDSYGRILLTVTTQPIIPPAVAGVNTPIQFGWNGINPPGIRYARAGDIVLVSGNRVKCAPGISGEYRIVQVLPPTGPNGNQVFQYVTSKYACCSPSYYSQFQGTVRALQYFYVAFGSYTPIKIGSRSTGEGSGPSRGRARAGCCS